MPTKDELEAAQEEYKALMLWESTEGKKIIEEIRDGGESIGLDTHRERFEPIIAERNRRFKEIRKKYHLDDKT